MGFGTPLAKINELIQAAHTITNAAVAVVEGNVDDIKDQTDKLAGEAPGESLVNANWQSGTADSGEPGGNLVFIGAADTKYKLHSLIVNIGALTNGASITIKLFTKVRGSDTKVYSESFTVGTDADGCWVVNGTLEIDQVLRVECESNNVGDNLGAITYKYDLEEM